MAVSPTLEDRVTQLEARMTALEQLPSRMDRLDGRMDRLESQMDQLRTEMRDDFSAVRRDLVAGDEALRNEMRTGHVMIVTALTEQIEESRRYTLVLFEESLSRIAVVSEGLKAQGQATASLATNLAALAVNLDESRTETRAMFDTLGTRLTTIEARLR